MSGLTRRSVFKAGAATAAGIGAAMGPRIVSAADRAGTKYNWGHTIDFGDQYHERVSEITPNICVTR
jgi:anaerobic selenocysteine-containing dehydrogenase